MLIYTIVNSESLKLYVGQHKGQNLRKYMQTKISDATHQVHLRSHLYAAMRQYPKDTWSIHPLLEVQTKAELDEWEQLLIYALKTQHPDIGYNICDGGEGRNGPHTEETKEKLRHVLTGIHRTEEQVQAQKERAKREYAESPEYRERLASVRVWHYSDESRKKMSDSHLGQSRPKTAEEKRKIGESNRKTWTPERRAAQAAQMKKNFGS